ncbi:sister chromatid cohesion 1 protein 4 isoform X2 [Cornus florida]|uniref:sister chromatid cohesion 1 protein 4 isoform X2 n=1 Tax=Cornus florida TaxID=4283 RepID=UPI00289875D2|nr:sister chromatid cohesion 1 protein 4 isoform X2 [Cornus florida]
MFYSQFILAKKGPLGTIWIAAHLERKLRKNQVADTDIGVSVDSILFPDVPIALRLSSHLLLGVVRIYSRKVNYLFDDCSEALLKVKQAFRSTAVDLPPEESTAPYHSITLPETFDLDDFELPDNDIFQGNYVDHHVSSREQITLQDTMEGVVYSTSQFGLDERFGDGDTAGLDLDEEIFMDNVAASGNAGVMLGSNADPLASVQSMTPIMQDENHDDLLMQDENHDEMNQNSDGMLATGGSVNQIEVPTQNTDFIDYAQAPCTPGLVEEPNLSNVQEASGCDDHLESEDHNLIEFSIKDNLENANSESGIHYGNKNVVKWSLLDNMSPENVICTAAVENGCPLDAQEFKQLKSQGELPTAVTLEHISSENHLLASLPSSVLPDPGKAIFPVSEFSDKNNGANGLKDLQNAVVSNNEPGDHSVDGSHADCVEPQGVRLDQTEASPSVSHETPVLEDPFGRPSSGIEYTPEKSSLTSTYQSLSEGILEINQASLEPEVSNIVEESGTFSNLVASNAEFPCRPDLENPETQACQEPKDYNNLSPTAHVEIVSTNLHVLQPCNLHLNHSNALDPGGDNSVIPDLLSKVGPCSLETSGREEAPHTSEVSIDMQGEGCHATDVTKLVLEENHTIGPAFFEDQVGNVISGDTQLEKLDGFDGSELPAPEKFLSVPESLAEQPNILLVESTPDNSALAGGDGMEIISGKKRSFTESTLTMQSLNSVESLGVAHSKRTEEYIPDDNDLLSSILVGRRSSVLKMKPTPLQPPEITTTKRPRTANRASASKRKVLMDDNMVLHGDTIRQQLTSTEDIRRVRKKAPCTRPEIWAIQKQFLEDEIFSEYLFTGLSMELVSLHNHKYDLSEIRVSHDEENSSSPAAANNTVLSVGPNVTNENGNGGSTEPVVFRNDVEAEPSETPVQTDNQQGEEHALSSLDYDAQMQVKTIGDLSELRSSQHELLEEIVEMEIDGERISVADAVNPATSIDPVSDDMTAGSEVQSCSLAKISADASLQMEIAGMSADQKLDIQCVKMDASVADINSGKGGDANKVAEENDDNAAVVGSESTVRDEVLLEDTEGGVSVEIGAGIQTNCSPGSSNPCIAFSPDTCGNQVVVNVDSALEEIWKDEHGVVNEDEVLAAEFDHDDKNLTFNGICNEERKMDSSSPAEFNADVKDASLNDGEYPGCQEGDPNVEIAAIDHTAIGDRSDFDYSSYGHDTGFLNVDDDEVNEEEDDFIPSAEETHFIENSGWSSRTRAVAKYLQTLFDKEAEHRMKALPMDTLLAGKTRKEASRMFFEALVLKTKDYIHVEQENPFDNIVIKPHGKLIKSDF